MVLNLLSAAGPGPRALVPLPIQRAAPMLQAGGAGRRPGVFAALVCVPGMQISMLAAKCAIIYFKGVWVRVRGIASSSIEHANRRHAATRGAGGEGMV